MYFLPILIYLFLLMGCHYPNPSLANNIIETMLDTKRNNIRLVWEIDTSPERRRYMKYVDNSSGIDTTFLNCTSSSEIDLSSFGAGVEGIWVFPHSRKFGLEFYAYFTRLRSSVFYKTLEIVYYLHRAAELRYFNHSDATNPMLVFKGNESISPGWQSVEFNTTDDDMGTMTFRLEFHTHQNGDFALLDKIIGHYETNSRSEPHLPNHHHHHHYYKQRRGRTKNKNSNKWWDRPTTTTTPTIPRPRLLQINSSFTGTTESTKLQENVVDENDNNIVCRNCDCNVCCSK